jgi:hypothetical protein
MDIDIIVIFRLFGKIPRIPERGMIIGNVEYLTRSISGTWNGGEIPEGT